MPFTFVDASAAFTAGGSTTVATAAFSATTGNLILVSTRCAGAINVSSVTDTAGNTYTFRRRNGASGNTTQEVWECQNCTGNASNVITVTFSSSASSRGIYHAQYSNSSAYDYVCAMGMNSQAISNSTMNMGEVVLTNGVAVGFSSKDATGTAWTAATGSTERAEDASNVGCVDDWIVTTKTTVTVGADNGAGVNRNMIVVAYQDTVAASAGGSHTFVG